MKTMKKLALGIGLSGMLMMASALEVRNLQQSQFGGIGITLQKKGEHLVIRSVLEGSPADQAGLQAGDLILNVDGLEMESLPMSESVAHMRGEAGDLMNLVIERQGSQTLDYSVPRVDLTVSQAVVQENQASTVGVSEAQRVLNASQAAQVYLNGKSLESQAQIRNNSHLYSVEYGKLPLQGQMKTSPLGQHQIELEEVTQYEAQLLAADGRLLESRSGHGQIIEVNQEWASQKNLVVLRTETQVFRVQK